MLAVTEKSFELRKGSLMRAEAISLVCRHTQRCTSIRPVMASFRSGTSGASSSKPSLSPLRAAPAVQAPVSSAETTTRTQPENTDRTEDIDRLERSLRLENTPSTSGASKRTVSASELLTSTWEHRLITGGSISLIALLLCKGATEIHSPVEALSGLGAALFAYYLSDFLTGVYHWGVDNYGDGDTPVVGDQIAAFQGHHQKPWTITEREFCNNVHKVFKPAAPFAALCLFASLWTPSWLDIGVASATFLTCMSQQFHAWSHMKASDLPAPVKALQDRGILVSRKAHGAHHKAPFEGNYCIVSGAWNPILDAGGDHSFFRRLERFVKARTGVEPRCWHEPHYSWQEME